MSNTTNRPPLANIDANIAAGTRRRSKRTENKPRITEPNAIDSKIKQSFYNFFDVVFENDSDENPPYVLKKRRLFRRVKYEETSVVYIRQQISDAVSFLSRAVPCIAKLLMPNDPKSIINGLYNSIAKNFDVNRVSKAEVEALEKAAEMEAEAASYRKKLAEVEAKYAADLKEQMQKMKECEDAMAALEAKASLKETGKRGLPSQEWYDKLTKRDKCQFLSMFRLQGKGSGRSKREIEELLEFTPGGITRYHWREALRHQMKYGAGCAMPTTIKHRNKIGLDVMKNIMVFLGRSENVQRLAYGSKKCNLCNDSAVVIDAVQSNKTMKQLIADFIGEFHEDKCTLCAEERCPKKGE